MWAEFVSRYLLESFIVRGKMLSFPHMSGNKLIDTNETEAFPELQKEAELFSVATLSAV